MTTNHNGAFIVDNNKLFGAINYLAYKFRFKNIPMCEMLWYLVSLYPIQAFRIRADDKVVVQ